MERQADYSFEAERTKWYTPIKDCLRFCVYAPLVAAYKIKDLIISKNIKQNKLEQEINN